MKLSRILGGLAILGLLTALVAIIIFAVFNLTRPSDPGGPQSLPINPTPTLDPDIAALSPGTILIKLDPTKLGLPISPYIYGMAGTDESDPNFNYADQLRFSFIRAGGNPATRYNWVFGNAWNAARDWEFRNTNYGDANPETPWQWTADDLKKFSAVLLTIPTIGWVAKNNDNDTRSKNVPKQGGPPLSPGLESIAGYDPTANRELTSVRSFAKKPGPFQYPPPRTSKPIYQDEYVANLIRRFGTANQGGVKFYAMDNEPDLWSTTHTDVRPARIGYDEMLSRYTEYASAVKAVDSSARITGPVSWGWNGYFYSDLDRGNDNFRTAQDRKNHGDMPFLPWFLDQLRTYEQRNGQRLLDVLDIHYYPQAGGVFTDPKTDADTNALRLRSTRALWDNNYKDESWINTQVRLIPRMRQWIEQYYPSTKLGITEWNWGADDTLNGGLTIANVLGIYGREGVYMAAYWRFPPKDSPGFHAFKLFTNFDGKGSTFGDTSLSLINSNDSKVSAFAARDTQTGRLRLIVVNNQPDQSQPIQLKLANALPKQVANVYQLSSQTGNKLAAMPGLNIEDTNKLEFTIPAYSATLLDLEV